MPVPDREKIAKRLEFLRREIRRHNDLYFKKDSPEITDAEYDALLRELETIENENPELKTPDSPTSLVGAPVPAGPEARETGEAGEAGEALGPVAHATPMLSLEKALSPEELRAFGERVGRFLGSDAEADWFVMPKYDGLAAELVYRGGELVLASTRGDGRVGENVTANAMTVRNIPKKLPLSKIPGGGDAVLAVRGEILMEKREFARVNAMREEEGQPLFANPRNAAAGTMRQLDAKNAGERVLDFFAYGVADPDPALYSRYSIVLEKLRALGFEVGPPEFTKKAGNLEEALEIFRAMEEKRESLPFDADGLVINVDSLELRKRLGDTSRAPRYAVALKFKPAVAQTVVLDIEIQVGRTGALTPVAVMEPVRVGGAAVSQATLHNRDELERKDVRKGDTVRIHRAGDVIPEILGVVMEKRPPDSVPFEFPERCPVCGALAVRPEGEAVIRCPDKNCPAQIEERLIHFTRKNALDIEGLGPSLAKLLLKEGLVREPSDLFGMDPEKLAALPGMGKKSARNVLDSVNKARTADLWRFVNALSIRHVGERASQILAERFKSLPALSAATLDDLTGIEGVGPKMAESVVNFFQSPLNKEFLQDLLEGNLGIAPTAPTSEASPDGDSAAVENEARGKNFVFTGTLPTLSRDEAKAKVIAKGGKVLSAVSKKTDYAVLGENSGKKLAEARKLGVRTIDEEELLKLLGENP
ncbi:MAG: NAD-dependent DNA ligase LigA [Deltaproteobacteria bacterium]|jgi:DNA ligase (NAD+)|nr:NAD-dependent DNA ligase LigA [Deltaproteobacteria bacterium]